MNPLHLFWIIPVSVAFGFLMAALCAAAEDDEKEYSGLLTEDEE